jgi:hypothetical protein
VEGEEQKNQVGREDAVVEVKWGRECGKLEAQNRLQGGSAAK